MTKKITFDYSPKTKSLKHQIEATNYIQTHNIVPLFDEQGLGKSKTVIDALCLNIKSKQIDGALIICKKSLLHTWKNEVLKHSHLFPVILSGSKSQRNRSFLTYGHFYIANYESIIQDLELIELILKHKNFAIVLDESQKIKNPETKITKAILSLKDFSKKKIIITGTPIANKPQDIWSQFYFLDGGHIMGNDFSKFKKTYNMKLKGETSCELFQERLLDLRKKIEHVSIRRTKDILELPEKIYIDIPVKLSPKQQEIYDIAKRELYYEIKDEDGRIITEKIENYLLLLRIYMASTYNIESTLMPRFRAFFLTPANHFSLFLISFIFFSATERLYLL